MILLLLMLRKLTKVMIKDFRGTLIAIAHIVRTNMVPSSGKFLTVEAISRQFIHKLGSS